MKVVLYEPSGSGGIFHYTFELAESLAAKVADVLILTKHGYELGDLNRNFRISAQLQTSQIKQFFSRLKCQLLPKSLRTLGVSAHRSVTPIERDKPGGKVRRLVLWAELIVTLWRERPNVIHVQWLNDPGIDYYLLLLLKWLGFKIVYTAHNVIPHEAKSVDERIFRRIYRLVDRIIVHALSNKEEILACCSVAGEKISIIPHGAYTLFFRKDRLDKYTARAELGLPADGRIVLFFGTVREYKGLEYLVEAFRFIRNRHPNAFLLVVGDVPAADKRSVARYSQLLAELASESQVICRREYVEFYQVGKYFSACDLVVLPYVKTYQSGVLMLACAAGRPAVVTDTGGLSEVLSEGKSGIVVSPKSVEDLAAATTSLLIDPRRTEDMGRYALKLAQGKYSWDNIARQTIQIYKSVACSD